MKSKRRFTVTPVFVFVSLMTAATTLAIAAAEEKGKPFTVPVAGMRLEPDVRNQVSGLALTVEDAGWPAITMLGNRYGTLGELAQLNAGSGLTPEPFQFGAVRGPAAGQLVDQQVNAVSNTLTFRNGKNESLKVTVTRLSPAILLEATGTEIELFGGADKPTPERNSVCPPPLGTIKPLRWATPSADGKVITGVLGDAPAPQLPLKNWQKQRVTAVSSLATEKTSEPPVDDLGQTWLLLWYGSGSSFLSSKIPAVLSGECYFPGNPLRMATVFQADVPFLLVFEKSPRSIELRQEGNTHRLVVTYPGTVGKVVMLPLFGHDVQAAETTEKWLQEFPAELKTRCDGWAKRLGDFPVNVKEEDTYDEKADQVTCTDRFEYINVRAEGEKTALVRPMLALGLQQKLPAVVTPQPVDLKYATQFGPLLAVPGNRCEWHLGGLGKYVNGQPILGPSNEKSAALERELSAEVEKILKAGHLAPWIMSIQAPWCPSYGTTYGKDPSEVLYFLSEFLPLLPEVQQATVRDYLAKEAAAYPPDTVLQLKSSEGVRREFSVIPVKWVHTYDWPLGKSAYGDEYYEDVPSLFRAYGVSRFYMSTRRQPPKELLEFWLKAKNESLLGRDWATLGWFWGKYAVRWGDSYLQYTPRAIHRDAAGLIGYLRLCRSSGEKGESDAWGQLARLMTFRFALVRYGQYLAESGLFQMPENPAAAKYLALSGNFSKAENHFEQVWEVNQHEVTMRSGASKIDNNWYGGFMFDPNGLSNQYVFSDLTPEVGRILANWGLKESVARYVKHYAEVQGVWYKSNADNEHLQCSERACTTASDSYQYFVAHAWIAGTAPEELEHYIDEPWVATGDYYFMHKLAETIKAYRGAKWEDRKE